MKPTQKKRNLFSDRPAPQQPKLNFQEKADRVLATINQATQEHPLTFKGIASMTELSFEDIRIHCEKFLQEKQINQILIPDAHFPTQKVRAFFRKY